MVSSSPKNKCIDVNKMLASDHAIHDWYRFVLSFPPHLVRHYVDRFRLGGRHRVLDPFCGTGTTIVECKKLGIPSVGIEANPVAHFASKTKVDWRPDPDGLLQHSRRVAASALGELERQGIEDNPLGFGNSGQSASLRTLAPESTKLLLTDSISALPLHKTLVLLDCLTNELDQRYYSHERLAMAKALVSTIGNLHFGPEVGVGMIKADSPAVSVWLNTVRAIADDLHQIGTLADVPAAVHCGDARCPTDYLEPKSVDAVITSPPYPNEKDYTRTTRLESVILGFTKDKKELRALKRGLVRSNTRGVYEQDDDDGWIADHLEIGRIAQAIENRRIELGKTSGFERQYARVTKLYFGGMKRHLAELRTVLRPGAHLAYVVGDQASYLRVMIRTGQLLADIAVSLGYQVSGIELFRTRLATATKEQLREEVVVLQWPG